LQLFILEKPLKEKLLIATSKPGKIFKPGWDGNLRHRRQKGGNPKQGYPK